MTESELTTKALKEIRDCLNQEGLTRIEQRWAAYGVWRFWVALEPDQAIRTKINTMMQEEEV